MNDLVVLGVTGSIGRQTLEVAEALGLAPVALAAGTGTGDFVELAETHPGAELAVADPQDRRALADRFGTRIDFGSDAVAAMATRPNSTVINGIVGFAGLDASLAALAAGNRLGLANKESLVAAGPLVTDALASGGGELIPVDSEHSAIFQCLIGEPAGAVRRLVLTASGGPFRERAKSELERVTVDDALAHPTWDMGPRITIDSATLVNKGLEVIEAHHLFGVGFDDISVVVHPQSIVHSLVEFVDGSLKAHVGDPDMRIPIRYAITHPDRAAGDPFELAGRTLEFHEPDTESFPALALAYAAGRAGGGAPAAFNAADEVAVDAFLTERIGFLDVARILEETLDRIGSPAIPDVETVHAVDAEARHIATETIDRAA